MSFIKCLSSIIVFSYMILIFKCSFLIIINVYFSIFTELRSTHVSCILKWRFLFPHSFSKKKFIFLSKESLFLFFLLLHLYSFLQFIMIQIFICTHIIHTRIFINFNLIDKILINLRSQYLSMMFVGFEKDSVSYFLLIHEFLLFYQINYLKII